MNTEGREMKKYILWDTKDGPYPPLDENGDINTSGLLGHIDRDNVYLRAYADGDAHLQETLDELEVGQCRHGVIFRLSGEKGIYDVYRVA